MVFASGGTCYITTVGLDKLLERANMPLEEEGHLLTLVNAILKKEQPVLPYLIGFMLVLVE